jgi:hypothetical protein
MKREVMIILLAGPLFAQTPIQDVSAAGGPLSLSGTTANIVGQNVSQKEILLYVIEFKAVRGVGGSLFRHDYYFKPNGVLPGTTENISEMSPEPIDAALSLGVVQYVQFVDGTEWGDRTAGDPIIGNRKPVFGLFSQMITACNAGGRQPFSNS